LGNLRLKSKTLFIVRAWERFQFIIESQHKQVFLATLLAWKSLPWGTDKAMLWSCLAQGHPTEKIAGRTKAFHREADRKQSVRKG
jgi:hypothetical protein